jgi:riboflavin transporter FmnP
VVKTKKQKLINLVLLFKIKFVLSLVSVFIVNKLDFCKIDLVKIELIE